MIQKLATAVALAAVAAFASATPAQPHAVPTQAQPQTPYAVSRTAPRPVSDSTTAIVLPNYHWNASSGAAVGECSSAVSPCYWVRLPAGQRTDSYLHWTYAYGVAYEALACFDFWRTPADNTQLGWTFAGRVTVTYNTPVVWLDRGYHWKYAIHTTIRCP
jgi:hypothetical protein